MKQIIFLTALLLLIVVIVSCSSNKNGIEVSETQKSMETTVDTITAVDDVNFYSTIDSKDYGGKLFRILLCSGYFFSPYDVSEENGEILNDAAYKRNINIEENLNAKIQYTLIEGSGGESANELMKNVQAGDLAYELVIVHPFIQLTSLIGGGYVMNWNEFDNINFNNSWWNQSFNEALVIGDILPCASSDFIYFNTNALYFNKDIYDMYALDNPYDLVYNNKWTWDKLGEISKTAYLDLNGDGERGKEDQYGYSVMMHHRMVPLTYSCDILSATVGSDGYPTLSNINSEKMINIVNMFYSLLYENEGVFPMQTNLTELDIFRAGQVMLFNYVTQNISALRDLEFDYGMLPMPMYNENQAGYYSLNQSNVMVTPLNLDDTEFFGTVIEALSYESYESVIPALYEVTFENKYLRDEDSYKIFNIIKNSLVYDILWNYSEGSQMAYFLPNLMIKKTTDLTSLYESSYLATENQMKSFYDMAIENYGSE